MSLGKKVSGTNVFVQGAACIADAGVCLSQPFPGGGERAIQRDRVPVFDDRVQILAMIKILIALL